MSGEHRGDFMGVPATGRPHGFQAVTITRFGGDQVAERWTTADVLGLTVQLGAVPAPVRAAVARSGPRPASRLLLPEQPEQPRIRLSRQLRHPHRPVVPGASLRHRQNDITS